MNTKHLNPELVRKYGVKTIEDYADMMVGYYQQDKASLLQEMANALSDEEAKQVGSQLTTDFHYEIYNSDETEEQFLGALYLNRSPS